ncbi:phosphoribosylamine--glycine ligase [Treponema sp. OMZ 840]|uniref:phosphoribosylamine--glycine ligase n=1 Tax=Treponema sp. OMZ 840 TaxID=244313 RepID=UPI003D94C229
MNVMLIGSGGREHALCWALAKSDKTAKIVCVPGNAGTAAEAKTVNVKLPSGISPEPGSIDFFVKTAGEHKIDFVLVGPEAPLCAGLADALWEKGIPVVGPKKDAAELEGSKDFAKNFMKKYGIACADSITVTEAAQAESYIKTKGAPIVIKADGLAAGKGVVVAATREVALKAVNDFMKAGTLGQAGKKLVLEEYLQGSEISVLAAVSVSPELARKGKAAIVPFVAARDHKRLLDGARGANTGGMGAVAPVPGLSADVSEAFARTILEPTLKGFIAERIEYRGFIFFGLMLTDSGPKLLEYNVRLGDPETQAVLPLLDCDFAHLCKAILDVKNEGTLKEFDIRWKKGFVCAPVAVSGGYPEKYRTGFPIMQNVPPTAQNTQDVKIFFAGAEYADSTRRNPPQTSGGRVLAVSAFAPTLDEARSKAYEALKTIRFENMFYRTDIGLPGAADSGNL